MELALSLAALLVAAVALGLVLRLRSQVPRIPPLDTRSTADLEQLKQQMVDVQRDVERSQRELDELKSVTLIPPAPPLPRARSVGLPDLREQLRAAHREPEPPSEE